MCKECDRKNNLVETKSLLKQERENLEELKSIKGFDKIIKPLGDKSYEDLSGQKFGRLSAVRAVGRDKTGRVLWLCKCECGNLVIVTASSLKRLAVKSCGCLTKDSQKLRRENLEGKVFTRWTVIKDTLEDKVLCRCSCGTERWVKREYLRNLKSRSCGCLRNEEFHEKYRKVQVGQVYGRLTVKKLLGRGKSKRLIWEAECSCGNIISVSSHSLLNNKCRSCGCLKSDSVIKRCTKPMIDKTFGRLTVIEFAYKKNGVNYYRCQCSCGNSTVVRGADLRSGNTTSCGCVLKEKRFEYEDLSGRKFGKLIVLRRVENKGSGHSTKYLCKCECGGLTETSRDSLLTGETLSCGCINSKGEYKVAFLLREEGILFEKQKIYRDLITESKYGLLKFDFYIPNENYLIEYDGSQHFGYSGKGWNTKENFEKIKVRDEQKNEYCKEHGIPLIRIPYTRYETLKIDDLKLETTKFRVV